MSFVGWYVRKLDISLFSWFYFPIIEKLNVSAITCRLHIMLNNTIFITDVISCSTSFIFLYHRLLIQY